MARTRTTILMLVVASLTLVLWDLRTSDTALRGVAAQVIAPLQRTAAAVFAPLGSWARDVEGFTDPFVRQARVAPVEPMVPQGWETAVGRVIAADIGPDRGAVTIDVGAGSGVREGNAVLGPGGVVGQVARVTGGAAVVRLVTDPASTIGVRLRGSREMGVATGRGMGRPLALEVINPAAQLQVGGAVETLGSVERFGVPADLPVGSVESIGTEPAASGRNALMSPVASMTSLEAVVVLTEPR
jgi:rod shape-determining protein MreC